MFHIQCSMFHVCLLCALAMLTGCFPIIRQQGSRLPPLADMEQTSVVASSLTTTETVATAVAPQPPAAVQPPPPPPSSQPAIVIKRKPVGEPYLMTTTDVEVRKSHSLQIVNTSEHFVCVVSPTMTNGDPVFKLRRNAQQNLVPVPPGWRVPCAAVIAPNLSEQTEVGPEANLGTQYTGTFRITVILLDYDAVNPQVVRTVISDPLRFPFTHGTNALCPEGRTGGCMYIWPIRP
ncbi:MAG: hypothetical protein WC766_03095 [Patescibacteria group bacterium]